jgi:hypothetical protein
MNCNDVGQVFPSSHLIPTMILFSLNKARQTIVKIKLNLEFKWILARGIMAEQQQQQQEQQQ